MAKAEVVDFSLIDLKKKINAEHRLAGDTLKDGLRHAIAAGEYLSKAKKVLGHGKWIPWIEENCEFDVRLSQLYISCAKLPSLVGSNTKRVSYLSFREAAKIAPKLEALEPERREEAIRLVDTGEADSLAQAVKVVSPKAETQQEKTFDPEKQALKIRERLMKMADEWPAKYRALLAIELRNISKAIEVMK